ncbi:hypothetical protein [Promicromonospora sp. NPDC060271]|uniref:hypothetical protein n=1 Tax=Promicromonospora sp. NPDC060271 TaxID=3347089 RepID=UPI0036684371
MHLDGGILLGALCGLIFVGARAFHAFGSLRYERVVLCLLVVSALVSVAALVVA